MQLHPAPAPAEVVLLPYGEILVGPLQKLMQDGLGFRAIRRQVLLVPELIVSQLIVQKAGESASI